MDVDTKQNKPPDRRQRKAAAREVSPIAPISEHESAAGSKSFLLANKQWLVAIAIVAAVFIAYLPCWHGGWLWDDESHLLNNPVLKPGGLAKIWVPGGYLNYWPLTFTAYWLQFHLWGLTPLGFHLVNLALHAISALLVWRVLLRLQVPGALFAAAIFALHPVSVDTAAWIAHLKDILSLALALVSMMLYLDSERLGSRWRYAAAIVAFLLSALAKGTAVTLPVVLLACAWWQRGRIDRRDVLRVVPYFLIGAVMAGIEVWTQHSVAGRIVVRDDGFFSRLAVAGCALWFYLGKLILPMNLGPIYPRWSIDARNLLAYLPGLMWVAILAAAWWKRQTWGRPLVMLMICYTALLLPALGFVNIYFMRFTLVSDHWQYIATIVPFAVLAGLTTGLARRFLPRPAAISTAASLLLVLGALSFLQSGIYRDGQTFYETVLAKNPDCWMAESNLGMLLQVDGHLDAATAHYRKALALKPDYAEADNNLGNAFLARGQLEPAIKEFQAALAIRPDYPQAENNWGLALAARGETTEAISRYQRAVLDDPTYAEAYYNLGNALLSRKEYDAAIPYYRKAIEITPDSAGFHNNLANALFADGQVDAAIAHYQKAMEIKPDYTEARNNLAAALTERGQVDAVIARYQQALAANPNDAEAQFTLGNLLAGRGEVNAAISHFQKAVELKPDFADAHYNLGTALLSRKDFDAAIAHFRKVIDAKPDYAEGHYALGNALWGQGQADAAIAQFQKAVEINPSYAAAQGNLATALASPSRDDFDSAIIHYQKELEVKPDSRLARENLAAVRAAREKMVTTVAEQRAAAEFRPNDAAPLGDLAWTLATNPNASIRNGAEAVELAERASKLSGGKDAAIFETLAAAYAEAGRFPDAAKSEELAEQLASADNQPLLKQIRARLELYKSGKPLHQVPQPTKPNK